MARLLRHELLVAIDMWLEVSSHLVIRYSLGLRFFFGSLIQLELLGLRCQSALPVCG
jgi:hypothetical protein